MKLLVDGVCFQLARGEISRIWTGLLSRLARHPELEIVLLDRGNAPSIEGVQAISFPSYTGAFTAGDSFFVDHFCQDLKIDVFASSFYTTPIAVPSILLVYDTEWESSSGEAATRAAQEKETAIFHANQILCFSKSMKADLARFYGLQDDRVTVVPLHVDEAVFRPRDAKEINALKARLGLPYDYFLISRGPSEIVRSLHDDPLFEAALTASDAEFVVLSSGERMERQGRFQASSKVMELGPALTDQELAYVYAGASALIHSGRVGTSLPIVEAMACGCPVITTSLGAPREAGGDAALILPDASNFNVASAMAMVQEGNRRHELISKGLKQAAGFRRDMMENAFLDSLKKAKDESETPAAKEFFAQWQKLRSLQNEVDVGA
ncbi:MAG: glycosyltransferase [Methylovirgula sp.]